MYSVQRHDSRQRCDFRFIFYDNFDNLTITAKALKLS